jgi:hypothetical protein
MRRFAVLAGSFGFMALSTVYAADTPGLPNSNLTPGQTRKVTKDQICSADYQASVKPISDSARKEAFGRYGLRDVDSKSEVLDFLVPVELGGSNDIENLWPQPTRGEWSATQKDALEQKLHEMVCDGSLTLKDAQNAIRKNWVQAYQRYMTEPKRAQ